MPILRSLSSVRTAALWVLLGYAVAPSVAAQDGAAQGGRTPEALALAYMTAATNGNGLDAARLLRSETRQAVGEAILVLAGVDNDEYMLPPLIREEDKAGYEGLSASEAYERFYRLADEQNAVTRMGLGMRTSEVERLGTVAEGDTLHVLFRLTPEGGRVQARFEVVSLQEEAEGWRVLPTDYASEGLVTLARMVESGEWGRRGEGMAEPPPPPRAESPPPVPQTIRRVD